MTHRRTSALALVVAGTLGVTTLAVPAAFAADGGVRPHSGPTPPSVEQSANPAPASSSDEPTTIIVQLEAGAEHAQTRERITASVAEALPSASVTTLREYTHAFQGFAIEAPASALAAIQRTESVKTAAVARSVTPMAENDAAPAGAPVLKNASALEMTRANQAAQKGDHQVIEVIDSGLDTSHPAFSGALDAASLRMTHADVTALAPSLPHATGGTWVSDKIPFAYDYADNDADVVPASEKDLNHGTHVTAIAAANGGEVRGSAPNAQIIVAKVIQDADGVMSDAAMLAALDDALVIKPDVINISLGDDSGMSSEAGTIFADVYKALVDAGITVNAASGNAFSTAYGNNSGQNKPFASDPDTGTLGEPASYRSTLAVASVDAQDTSPYVLLGDRKIPYGTAIDGKGDPVPSLRDIPEKTYRIVYEHSGGSDEVQRYWSTNRYDLSDAIVLEDKGGMDTRLDIPMTDDLKASYLTQATPPPAALIIADTDEADAPYQAILESTREMPTVTITKKDSDAIHDAIRDAEGEDVYLTVTHSGIVLSSSNPTASEFSAWGVTPDLRLKPEVAAPGGNITSAILNGEYASSSGTSMASPHVAGINALVRERVASDPLFGGMDAAQKNAVVTNFLMGTAHPLIDVELGDGTFYSPRKVGAGQVDAVAATTSSVYPTVIGASDPSRPKADLGDGTKGWTFQVQLTNLAPEARTYTLGGQALSEVVEEGMFLEHSQNWAGQGISLTFSSDSVTVPASSSATVTVTVTPEAEFASYAAKNAPKGTFIDGAVTFTSTDGAPDLTVPYVGFYGSWGAPAIFDEKWSDEETHPAHVYRSALMDTETEIPLGGLNPLADKQDYNAVVTVDPTRLIASRSQAPGAPHTIAPRTGMLRAVPQMSATYTNEAGDAVRSYTLSRVRKSLYDLETGYTKPGEFTGDDPIFDGLDEAGKELPDGCYRLTLEAATDGPSSTTQQMSYDFTLDTRAPVISSVAVAGEGEARTLSFDVADSSPLAGVELRADAEDTWYYRQLLEGDGEVQADGTHRYHVEVPVADLNRAWAEQGNEGEAPVSSFLVAWDWGLNPAQQAVHLDGSAVPDPVPNPDLAPNPDPVPVEGEWVSDGRGWWYRWADGSFPKGTVLVIGGSVYRFDESGYMRTGWVKDQGLWFYHQVSGAQVVGWVKQGASWFYLDETTGAMVTGWLHLGSSWFYMSSEGVMTTGWVRVGGSWFFLNPDSGAMATGWMMIRGSWYYFDPADGAMVTGWLRIGDSWYFLKESGVMVTGWVWIGGTWYFFSDSGQWS